MTSPSHGQVADLTIKSRKEVELLSQGGSCFRHLYVEAARCAPIVKRVFFAHLVLNLV